MHQAFHVVVLVGFLAAVAMAFIGVASRLLFPESPTRPGAFKASILLGLVAGAGLAADWAAHNILGL